MKIIFFIIIVLSIFKPILLLGKNQFNIKSGFDRYFGYTLYQIGGVARDSYGNKGKLPFPISELKFPLEVWMANLTLTTTVKKK